MLDSGLLLPDAPRGKVTLAWRCHACNLTGPGVFKMGITYAYRETGSPVIECNNCHIAITCGQFFQQLTDFVTYLPIVSDRGQRSAS